jgi:hypothetical protein
VGELFETIRRLVREDRYLVGLHASERLEERGILEWQAVVGIELGNLIAERQRDLPNPVVEVSETLPDGTEFKAVWSYLKRSNIAKLVTVHYYDED